MVIRPSGGLSEADPPVPIPNTEVKRFSADDTALATVWENRSLPGGLFLFPRSSAPIGDSSHFPVKFNPLAGLSDVWERGKTLPYGWFASIFPCATMNLAFGERRPGYLESQGKLPALRVTTLSPWSSLTDII